MYVILTSKPGQYRAEVGKGMKAIEAWDYMFCGRLRAQFVIAEITGQPRVRIVDLDDTPVVNELPSKFLPKYGAPELARAALQQMAHFGDMDIALVQRPL